MQVELSTGSTSTITQSKLDNISLSSTNVNNTNGNTATSNISGNSNQIAEIQAQFELSIELRKFINIDLFQRGYYQIRLSIKCANKQIPTKIVLTLENSQSNNNLSDVMFPSCVIDEYAVSKTFLILYRNEEIILDDHVIFKISTIVNAFNLVESFEKLDLQLNIELWFTETDFKPLLNSSQDLSNTGSAMFTNLNNISNSSANSGSTGGNNMQQLCVRTFKIKFDPRQGIHLQIPVLFDYFHLSCVLVTMHCTLLTLLPPVMLGSNLQRNLTLSSILFGKDLSQFKSMNEITSVSMKRAVHIHNQICGLLLASYENLQDHIIKLSVHLTEFERKKINLDYVNCQEKLKKICEIVQNCSDPETLDDLANRHVAQCSAENIMQWCLYIDNFSLNQATSPFLAIEYHNKRLKRFSESFFTKDLSRKNLYDYEASDNYVGLNELIRQSAYFQQIPELIVSCDDLDGTPENIPIIFEENYVDSYQNNTSHSQMSSSSSSSSFTSDQINNQNNSASVPSMNTSSSTRTNILKRSIRNNYNSKNLFRRNSSDNANNEITKDERSTASENSNTNSAHSQSSLTASNRQLHKKLRKKTGNSGDSLDQSGSNKAITLVSYKKVNDYFNDQISIVKVSESQNIPNSSTNNKKMSSPAYYSSSSSGTPTTSDNIQSKLSIIKADLAARSSLSSSSSTSSSLSNTNANSNIPNKALHSIIESKIANQAQSATDLLFGNDVNNSLNSSLKSNEEFARKNHNESELDLGDIMIGIERTSSNKKSTPTHPDSNTKQSFIEASDEIKDLNFKNPNDGAPPSDCSLKSRVLFESFRGKNSTIERPKRQRKSILNSNSSDTGSGNGASISRSHRTSESSSYDESAQRKILKSNANETELLSKAFSLLEAKEKSDSTDSNNKPTMNELNISIDNKLTAQNIESLSLNTPVPSPRSKLMLKKQLTINSDRSALSAILNENVYKFVVAKEELKKMLAIKYKGNIYSEFSTLFCTAPYFYPDLTPKITPSDSFDSRLSNSQSIISKNNSLKSSLRSKHKFLKKYSDYQNESDNDTSKKKDTKKTTKKKYEESSDVESNSDQDSDDEEDDTVDDDRLHLCICVHGLDGNSGDLRLIRTYLELALPGAKLDFLMSEHNQENTFDDIEIMTVQLIKEINDHIESYGLDPYRISFIGHSLGNLIVRSTVSHDDFKPFVGKLHTYLSLSGPHLGTLYNSSGLINIGMWVMQKWKKSGSLLQLSLKDNSDMYKTFLYKLSAKPAFEYFKNVLLVASPQDRYVPFHSARIEMCKAALKDNVYGPIYKEMVTNILKPIKENPNITFKRYSAFHTLPGGTSSIIGRAAHIAVLDSELFVEKLILVSVAKYFR